MRLIDADALLNLPFEKMIHTDYGDTCVPIEEIELAPTVEAFTKDEYEGAYLRGYVDSAKANARPQGEWIIHNKGEHNEWHECPFCNNHKKYYARFCDYCGAEMRKSGQEVSNDN